MRWWAHTSAGTQSQGCVNRHPTRRLRVAYFGTEVWCRSDEPNRLWFPAAPGTRGRPENRSRNEEQVQE